MTSSLRSVRAGAAARPRGRGRGALVSVATVAVLLAGGVIAGPVAAAGDARPPVDLGTPVGGFNTIKGVSGNLIVGATQFTSSDPKHAFVYDRGVASPALRDLGTLGGSGSEALGIYGHLVVGDAYLAGDTASHAFAMDLSASTTAMTDLGTLGGTSSSATAVNGTIVVGQASMPGDTSAHAFAVDLSQSVPTMVDLGTLGGSGSTAVAVSGSIIVGNSDFPGSGGSHGFAYDLAASNPHMIDLGTLGGDTSTVTAVSGTVVVGSAQLADTTTHGFAYDLGATNPQMIDLGTLGGSNSGADAISGQLVVGSAYLAGDTVSHAIYYDLGAPTPSMKDLGTLPMDPSNSLPPTISEATAVDGKVIVGYSVAQSGVYVDARGFAYDLGSASPHMIELSSLTTGLPYSLGGAFGISGNTVVGQSPVVDGAGDVEEFHPTWWDLGSSSLGTTTATGANVASTPVDVSSGQSPATVTFASVSGSGLTSLTTSASGPSSTSFTLSGSGLYYDISTTAAFSGTATVCIAYSPTSVPDPGVLRLYHYDHTTSAWQDITASNDTVNGKLCGTTSSFSPFAIGRPPYPFRGFLAPVDNAPTINVMKAGAAAPVKFALGGNRGLKVLATGSPTSSTATCTTGAPSDTVELTVNAGASSLSYDATSDTYTYVWKTDKTWAGTCRQLKVALVDGTTHLATFQFSK